MGPLRLTLVLLLGLTACTQELYPGPKLRPHQIARLAPALDTHRSVYIDRVDGKPLGLFEDRVALLPGRHLVQATLALRVDGRRVSGTRELEFDAEAGRSYVVHGAWSVYGAHLWIVDRSDGLRVADRSAPPRRLPPVAAQR